MGKRYTRQPDVEADHLTVAESIWEDFCVCLAGASQTPMNALHHAFRNSQGFVTTLEPPLVVTPFNHTRFTVKYSANRLLTQGPKFGQFRYRKVSLERGLQLWKELKEKFDSLTGSFLACIRTSCSAIRKFESCGQPKLGAPKPSGNNS